MESSAKAKANFSRVCQLLVDKGGDALRAVLHAIHPPATLAAVLNTKRSVLQNLKVITGLQLNLLFPVTGPPDSKKFDITLLTILLRNICGLPPPSAGWNKMPVAGDVSKSDDIVRIKIFRNVVYGHIASTQLDDANFEKLWQDISQPLTRLGIRQKDIDEIKVAPLSFEEESYIEKLKEWKEREDHISSKLNNVEREVSDLRKTVENVLLTKSKPNEWEPTSCLPNILPTFTGREAEIQKVIDLLKNEEKAVVSLHGGPGFGKTAIAIQVSHKLSEDHMIPAFFSQLTTASTVDEMIRQLCLDVGVNHEDNPKQSLIFRLKNIKRNIILVMDDIENLLKEKYRSIFDDFIHLLLKHSNCQIITTSRSSYLIPEISIGSVDVGEMEDEACIELLKKQCRKEENEEECCHQDEKFLRRLAELCGNIPLAMCIAGSLVDDFEDSNELLQDLEKQPMKTLKCPESNQCVNRAINVSYEKCSKEKQETLVRLSVFEGSFSEDAARTVIEKDKSDTRRVLKELTRRSLIKESTKHRYSIHLLIKHFLKDKQKGGDKERALAAAMRAEVLMVSYYLELGHKLTIESYSKNGYKDNGEALQREASNIQNVLKICCQNEGPTSSDISDCLARSKIYTTSAKFFSLFVRTIIPGSIVDEFLQRCASLAEEGKQLAIKINFDLLLADQERIKSKSVGKSNMDLNTMMEGIKKEFETHSEVLKKDKSLCAHYYDQYGKYLSRKSKSAKGEERLHLQIEAREHLEKSLELRETLTDTCEGNADTIYSLLQLGKICKSVGSTERYLKKPSQYKTLQQAEKCYKKATELSEMHLGDHELTSSCYKDLGDLFLTQKNHDLAEQKYTTATTMRENLALDASERYVYLLNNRGGCLTETKRANEAIEVLERARYTAEKLAESDEPNDCKTKVYKSLAIAYDLEQNYSEAGYYARKALNFKKIKTVIEKYEHEKLKKISLYEH